MPSKAQFPLAIREKPCSNGANETEAWPTEDIHMIQVTTRKALTFFSAIAALLCSSTALFALEPLTGAIAVHKRSRVEENGAFVVREKAEQWEPRQTAVIVCDMWDAHHCLNAVRRVEEMAPRMNLVLENARKRGVLIIHAPSSCMEPYKDHPARKRAQAAPKAANLPSDIGAWCRRIPAEEKVKYPVDQADGGEDDDPVEHARWHERLAGMGRNPKSPWKAQLDVLRITDEDAISDSGVEIWNLLEQRGIRNVILLGVHTNMCVLGRPFGLRQMTKNGKNVVLMRDLTDTMYNPERWPHVTHHAGTDLIVEHIEKVVCPSILSTDFLGGTRFRFSTDRHSILIMIGEDEYRTDKTLPAFAKQELEPRGFQVRIVSGDSSDPNNFSGLVEAVRKADVVLVSVRRRTPPKDQFDALRAHVAAGKPLVGIRTASHAFAARDAKPLTEGHTTWPEFDAAVLGGHYVGHHGADAKVSLRVAPGAKEHPILRGVDLDQLAVGGSLYKTTPLAGSTTPLLLGTVADKSSEPVAWTNTPRLGRGRVFYTSLGHPTEFEGPAFRKLLLNGICWTLDIAAPAGNAGSAAARN
jgi:type 1 glutamine amidotransferase/nicotinamidase-related amidase